MSLKEKNIYITTQELQKRDTNQSNTQRKKRIRPQKPSNAITASMNAAVDKSTYTTQECASLQNCGPGGRKKGQS